MALKVFGQHLGNYWDCEDVACVLHLVVSWSDLLSSIAAIGVYRLVEGPEVV